MKPLITLLLLVSLSGCAGTFQQRAEGAAAADVVSTAVGLSMGAVEANPLGLATVPLKFVALSYADGQPTGVREWLQSFIYSVWAGATVSNLCVIASIASSGAFAPACLGVGLAAGGKVWVDGTEEREFWDICAAEKLTNAALTCDYVRTADAREK